MSIPKSAVRLAVAAGVVVGAAMSGLCGFVLPALVTSKQSRPLVFGLAAYFVLALLSAAIGVTLIMCAFEDE